MRCYFMDAGSSLTCTRFPHQRPVFTESESFPGRVFSGGSIPLRKKKLGSPPHPLGKRAAIVTIVTVLSSLLLFPCVQCFRVLIPPAVRPVPFTTDGYGIFNMRTRLRACGTHEGGSGTKKSEQELTRRDRKLSFTQPRQGIESRIFGFEFRRSNHS